MQLLLLRHGVAAARDARRYPNDIDRPLTPEGRARLRREARGLRHLGLSVDLLLTSPLTRARQTARIVASELASCPRPRVHRALAPGGATHEIIAGIPPSSGVDIAMLVGHEPDLTRLAADLLLPATASMSIQLKKGGLLAIDFDGGPAPGAGRLVMLAPPRLLRLLGAPA